MGVNGVPHVTTVALVGKETLVRRGQVGPVGNEVLEASRDLTGYEAACLSIKVAHDSKDMTVTKAMSHDAT
jgi:hypothetical protein